MAKKKPKKSTEPSFTDRVRRTSNKYFGVNNPNRNRNRLIGILIILGVGFLIFSPFLGAILFPEASDVGYAQIFIVDGETGDRIEGKVVVVPDSNQSDSLGEFDTGESIFISEPSFCYVKEVTLISDTGRTLLPKAFTPQVSQDPNNPANNTVVVFFYLDPADVNVNITRRKTLFPENEITGNLNETDIVPDVPQEIDLLFNISIRNSINNYGSSSFALDHLLEASYPDTLQANLGGYATWFGLNGTQPAGEVWSQYTDGEIETESAEVPIYVESENITIIPVYPNFMSIGNNISTVTLTFEVKSQPTNVFVFQGFLEDLFNTIVPIGIKNY